MKIHIVKKWWRKQKFHARIIHQNGNILWWSEPQANEEDLIEMIENSQRDFAKAKIVFDYDKPST